MTLNTQVAFLDPIEPTTAFQWALEAVCIAAQEPERIATAIVDPPSESYRGNSIEVIRTQCGQGLPAWTDVTYRTGGALYPEDVYDSYECDGEDDACKAEDCADGYHRYLDERACHLMLSWDTAYSYSGPDGMSCTALHAIALVYVAYKAENAGIRMTWKNEYTGQWHNCADGLQESLGEFLGAGADARDWFHNVVVPSIPEILGESWTF